MRAGAQRPGAGSRQSRYRERRTQSGSGSLGRQHSSGAEGVLTNGSLLNSHKISGGGGISLHVVETGNPTGRPILFIHGFSQCWLAWNRQLNSDLADDFRLVAMDLRGHGLSDKPLDGYSESRLWADDVNAVIQALSLDEPILCGWSYGPLVILDYIRHSGDDAIGGIHFVDGITKLGGEAAMAVLAPEFLQLIPGLFS